MFTKRVSDCAAKTSILTLATNVYFNVAKKAIAKTSI